MNQIPLNWSEIQMASLGGMLRWVRARADGRSHEPDRKDIGIERDICGAIAEFVVSKHYNICWSPAVGFIDTNIGDVGNLQVKSITAPHLCLIVKPDDNPDFPFVLVYLGIMQSRPFAELRGWMYGRDAKRDDWLRKKGEYGIHQTAFFVEQEFLSPIESLPIK